MSRLIVLGDKKRGQNRGSRDSPRRQMNRKAHGKKYRMRRMAMCIIAGKCP
jgi:hypothetical protein